MGRITIFLDDGGVMNNNTLRGPQWRQLVGAFFIPRLGGTAETWSEANRLVIDHMVEPQSWQLRQESAPDYASFDRRYMADWLEGMCALVQIPCPSEEECIKLAREAHAYIIPRVRAAFPGAVGAIRMLFNAGYTLHTASGEPSNELNGHLEGMGVRGCFNRLYGPDLVNTFKLMPHYYERIFADLGIEPAEALIVDDHPHCIDQAAQLGAHTVLIGPKSPGERQPDLHLASLAELPAHIHRFD